MVAFSNLIIAKIAQYSYKKFQFPWNLAMLLVSDHHSFPDGESK